ncbi:hypothetical protein BSKO_00979 [Bryopsis sp. KO-2023]|nr:hypothetical protein BSKO_00979 [Bryopsis sp. KO-2023]
MVLLPVAAAVGFAFFAAYVLVQYQGRLPNKPSDDSDDEHFQVESTRLCPPAGTDACNVRITASKKPKRWVTPITNENCSGADNATGDRGMWEESSRSSTVPSLESTAADAPEDESAEVVKHTSLRLNCNTSLVSVEFPDWTIHANDLFGDQMEDPVDSSDAPTDEPDEDLVGVGTGKKLEVPEIASIPPLPADCGLSYDHLNFQLLTEDMPFLMSCLKDTVALKTPITPYVPMV